jgi:hypothetical protein
MKTLNLRTTIGGDGTIDLHIHSDLPPEEADIVVVVRPVASAFPGPPFPSDEGVWAGLVRDTDIETDLSQRREERHNPPFHLTGLEMTSERNIPE